MFRRRLALTFAYLTLAGLISAGCAAGYSTQVDSIMTGDALNQISADSAPQQSVVNGWTARDLLELTARQNIESTFILYGLLAIGVVMAILLFMMIRRLSRLEAALTRQATEWQVPDAVDPAPPM